jgi:nucleoside-diphosphate-sugar epimerase
MTSSLGSLVVTGAGGFIGRRLCAHLAAAGRQVVAVSRGPLPGFPCPVSQVDVSDAPELTGIIREVAPVAIIHLASVGVKPSQSADLTAVPANLALAHAVVLAAASVPGCRVIHTGSMAEYGSHVGALHEDLPLAPAATTTAYALGKLVAGLHAQAMGARLGVQVVVARLFGVFGPGEEPHRLFPTLLTNLRAGQPVLLSDGRQRRDFIHVDDVCEVLTALADHPSVAGVVNIGSGEAVEVARICRGIAAALGADPALLRFGARPRSPGDTDLLLADTRRLADWLGRVPPARLAGPRIPLELFT